MHFDQTEFGRRLKELRTANGMTQEQLADKIGITREHMGRIERGKYGCSLDLLLALSFELHVSTDFLLMGKNPDHGEERERLCSIIAQLSDIVQKM